MDLYADFSIGIEGNATGKRRAPIPYARHPNLVMQLAPAGISSPWSQRLEKTVSRSSPCSAAHMSWSPQAQFCTALARSWLDMRTRTELATASTPPQHLSPPTMGRTPSLWRVGWFPKAIHDRFQTFGEHAEQIEHRIFVLIAHEHDLS